MGGQARCLGRGGAGFPPVSIPPTPTWETLDLLKVLAIQSDATFRRSAVDQEDLKPY